MTSLPPTRYAGDSIIGEENMSAVSFTSEEILAQEAELQFEQFDTDTAWEVGSALRAEAVKRKAGVVIAISRNGQLLFYSALAGTSQDNAEWVRRKSAVTNRFQHASLYMRLKAEAGGADFNTKYYLSTDDYLAHGGCFPLGVRGAGVIGTITVSGLPQLEDHALIVDVLRSYLKK